MPANDSAQAATGNLRSATGAAPRRARPIYRVFVSSTWLDLQPERRALMDALNRMEEMRFVGMEFFGNRPDDTHDASIDQVNLCEVLVAIIGHRYGSGITEAEYRRARELKLPCFIYFKREDASRPELTDGDPAQAAKLTAFKQDLLRGHTVKEFTSPEELAANATADLHNWVAARWISVEPAAPPVETRAPVAAPDADRTNSLRLLERIEHDWIKGVLEASLHRRARLDLGLDWKDEAVEHPWDRILVAPDRPVQTLGERETIAEVFAAAQNTLLVLGEPGAGKTTTLLELARELVRRARESATEPLPVVLALSTWMGRHKALREWLIEELNLRYQVPKRLAAAWLEAGRLTLLLDGLDEVREDARVACVAAINAFAHEHAPAGLAVTCRVHEYSALKERLRLRSAICLQPLTPRQIDAYFERAGGGLENLRAAMREDESLRELAQTPLMLSVMTMAWRDAPAETLRSRGDATNEQRRAQLLDAYVTAALRRRPDAERDFSDAQTRGWLGWLARKMRDHGLTVFSPEQLQPSWLDGATRQISYFASTRVLAALILVIPFCFVSVPVGGTWVMLAVAVGTGLLIAALDYGTFRWVPAERAMAETRKWRVVGVLLVMVLAGAVLGPRVLPPHLRVGELAGAFSVYLMLVATALGASVDVKARDIHAADVLQWSWRRCGMQGLAALAAFQLLTIIVVGAGMTVAGAGDMLRRVLLSHWEFAVGAAVGGALAAGVLAVRRANPGWIVVGLLAGAVIGTELVTLGVKEARELGGGLLALGAIMGGVVGGIGAFEMGVIESKRARRSGVWFWLRVPSLAALGVGSVIATVVVVAMAATSRSLGQRELIFLFGMGAVVGAPFGLIAFFRFGGFNGVQHLVLRFLLVRSGAWPRKAARFFERAAHAALLQKVGFGYRFIHALLLDHLAVHDPAAEGKPVSSKRG